MLHDFHPKTVRSREKILNFDHPLTMGIINVSPDSFYAGSRAETADESLEKFDQMVQQGVDIIDIGAMSSRPGAKIISPEEEIRRLQPIMEAIESSSQQIIISLDTLHSQTAEWGIEKGVDMINDISGGTYDPSMEDLLAKSRIPLVCMHMRGTPKTMKSKTQYDDLISDLYMWFKDRIRALRQKGISDIILDPGFGFAKNREQNFFLLQHLYAFHSLGCPIMAGISRKSFIYKTLNAAPDEALNGTTALHTIALMQGVHILRVHDVWAAKEAITLIQKLREQGPLHNKSSNHFAL